MRTFTALSLRVRPTMRRHTMLLGLAAVLLVSGCNDPDGTSLSTPEPTPEVSADESGPDDGTDSTNDLSGSDPVPAADSPAPADQTLISEQGIGPATLGMTLDALKATLPDGVTLVPQAPFIVDFDAIAIQDGEETLFYLIHLAGDPLQGNDIIQGILTTNPRYQTAEGVGVGTRIQEAEAVYGEATLSHNTENESREYVRFEQHPSTNISFATQSVDAPVAESASGFAGQYDNVNSQYNETTDYRTDAAIEGVLLVCLSESCS